MATRVYLEVGGKRVFACSIDWPGWCRSGKTEELALDALAEYASRYAIVAKQAGVAFPQGADDAFDVVERVPGSATTDFGAPGAVPKGDAEPMGAAEARRQVRLLRAAWTTFDRTAAESPERLRKGPRGGGRDRDKMIDHVLGAESAYARKVGVKHHQPAIDDRAAIDALREAIAAVLARASDGTPLAPNGWPARYALRRTAWHVLDHAWEMADRAR
ncbi:MAG TPA: hypothetical protein VGJ63_06270 [Micromonosporaceae bacterium]